MRNSVFRALSIFIAVCMIFCQLPMLSASAVPEYEIGAVFNAVEGAVIKNNGVDATAEYKASKEIAVAANTRGSIEGIYFSKTPQSALYYFSADIIAEADSSSYGSIRTVLGSCMYNGNKKYIELCVRPSLSGQYVLFLNGNGEDALKVGGGLNIKLGDTYSTTAKYDSGKISYWVNGTLLFSDIALPEGVSDIELCPGFYSQHVSGKISNLAVWGDVDSKSCPEIGDNANIIGDVVIEDYSSQCYKIATDGYLGSAAAATRRTAFHGISYGSDYTLLSTAAFFDNKNMNGQNEIDWEGLILGAAKAENENGESCNIELRIRNKMLTAYAVNSSGESLINVWFGLSFGYAERHSIALRYHSDNTLSLWVNGTAYIYRLDLSSFGYTEVTPNIYLGSEVCAYSFEELAIFGDITAAIPEELAEAAVSYKSDYAPQADTTYPVKGEANRDYMPLASVYGENVIWSGGLLTVSAGGFAQFYTDPSALGALKRRDGEAGLATSDYYLENAFAVSDFSNTEEIAYSFKVSDFSGSLKLALRYSELLNKPLSLTLGSEGITVDNFGAQSIISYPSGISFSGSNELALRMGENSAVLFINGVACATVYYSEISLPVLQISPMGQAARLSDFSAYRLSASDPELKSRYILGDTNTDDYTDIRDFVRLKRYFAGSASAVSTAVGDINADGALSSLDLVAYRKALLFSLRGLVSEVELFHDQSEVYVSDIEPSSGDALELKIRVVKNSVTSAFMEYSTDDRLTWQRADMHYSGEDETGYYQYFSGSIKAQGEGIYYRFTAQNDISGSSKTIKNSFTVQGSGGNSGGWYCMVDHETPDWSKGALWYSLMPDAFYNGDITNDKLNSGKNTINSWNNVHTSLGDRYGGDLAGVEQKTEHIKSLGVDAIYMNPISKAYQNAGYGTVDYTQIEPAFGNEAVLERLVDSLHNNGLRMMTDVVLYFSPTDSIYLNFSGIHPLQGAFGSAQNRYTEMFKFTSWPQYEQTEWGGLYTNLFNSSLQQLLYKGENSALGRLVGKFGIDGLRFDCGGYLGSKTDFELRNSLIKDIRHYLKQVNPEAVMLSEYDYPGMTGHSWDSQWNLDSRTALDVYITGDSASGYSSTIENVKASLSRQLYVLPRQQALSIQNLISFHDDNRVPLDSSRGRAALLTQMTYIGSPVIYYGQEIGMNRSEENGISQGYHASASFYAMDWNRDNWDNSALSLHTALGALRKSHSALKTGALEDIYCSNSDDLYAFARYDSSSAVITLANGGAEKTGFSIKVSGFGFKDGSIVTDYFSGDTYIVKKGEISVNIPSGGTLLVSGGASAASKAKALELIGAGSIKAEYSGSGVYSLTLSEGGENSACYGAVVNGDTVYTIAKRSSGAAVMKQTQANVPEGAEVCVIRSADNVFKLGIISDGEISVVSGSEMKLELDGALVAEAKALGGDMLIKDVSISADKNELLYDDFGDVTAIWSGISSENINASGSALNVSSGSVKTPAPDTDWSAEIRILSGQGGIRVMKDENNYLSLVNSEGISLKLVTGGAEEILASANASADSVYLQISRIGTDYSACYSLDGSSWISLGSPIYYNLSAADIALFSDSSCSFDYFMLGNGISLCTPHTFGYSEFGYKESLVEPKYEIISGSFEYINEGIEITDNSSALMSITNKRYTDFYVNLTLSDVDISAKAGIAFGMSSTSAYEQGHSLYRNGNYLVLEKGGKSLKRATLSDDRIVLKVCGNTATVYNGAVLKPLFSVDLTDYSGGYVGFFGKSCNARFKNYYVSDIVFGWQRLQGSVWSSNNSITARSTADGYGAAAFRGAAYSEGVLNFTLNAAPESSASPYSAGIMLGAAYGSSPDSNGVCIAIENGVLVLKKNGSHIDSYALNADTANISVSLENGNYSISINNGTALMECNAPENAGGCITLYAIGGSATASNITFDN